jgi:dihydroorotase/N-acyl-D-amino-acid deacylase
MENGLMARPDALCPSIASRRRPWRRIATVTLAAAALSGEPAAQPPAFDIVLRGGRVVDGSGSPWFVADVGITGDTVAAIGSSLDGSRARVIDASGLVVSPGFIDVHSHSEDREQGIAAVPLAENNVRQGVTTVVANPDGGGEVPLQPFFERVASARPAINVGAFIGHGAVRTRVVGLANRAATQAELASMRDLVQAGMEQGALGLSTGLFYVPGNYAPLGEVVELARVVARYGGIHQSHMRNEGAGILESVRETIAIGEQGGLPTQVTHHKIIGKNNWGRSIETLRLVDDARARGVDVTIDQYPYTASSTSIEGGLVPQWAREGGHASLVERLNDPQTGPKVRAGIVTALETDRGAGNPDNVVLTTCSWNPPLAGRSLGQVLRDRGRPPTVAEAADLVMEIVRQGGCGAVYHAISEEDLVRIMRHPATMVASDAAPGEPVFGRDVPHPRAYGAFARVLGVYVRERGVLTLEDAVRKMSSLPSARVRLADRGVLRPGMKADIAVFDPARVRDLATFEKPHQYAEGLQYVLVNGAIVLDGGAITPARPGRVLYGPGAAKTAAGR